MTDLSKLDLNALNEMAREAAACWASAHDEASREAAMRDRETIWNEIRPRLNYTSGNHLDQCVITHVKNHETRLMREIHPSTHARYFFDVAGPGRESMLRHVLEDAMNSARLGTRLRAREWCTCGFYEPDHNPWA